MKELYEYREKLLARFREASNEFCDICESLKDPFTPVEEGWNAHQIAFHVRDVNKEVYGTRIRRTASENNPLFKNFDPDVWMAEHYTKDENIQNILNEFKAELGDLHKLLMALPHEAWSRTSIHEALGPNLTLQLWTERSLAHIEEHLAALKTLKK